MKISSHQDLIKSLLTAAQKYRDSDNKLIATVWHKLLENDGINSKKITGYQLLTHLSKGTLPTPESIARCRRKLQEHHEELRGIAWTKRHKKQTAVKEELKTMAV